MATANSPAEDFRMEQPSNQNRISHVNTTLITTTEATLAANFSTLSDVDDSGYIKSHHSWSDADAKHIFLEPVNNWRHIDRVSSDTGSPVQKLA